MIYSYIYKYLKLKALCSNCNIQKKIDVRWNIYFPGIKIINKNFHWEFGQIHPWLNYWNRWIENVQNTCPHLLILLQSRQFHQKFHWDGNKTVSQNIHNWQQVLSKDLVELMMNVVLQLLIFFFRPIGPQGTGILLCGFVHNS